MSPIETWLFIGVVFLILLAAVYGGGRAFDWLLDQCWGRRDEDLDDVYRRERAMGIMESWTTKDKE